MKDASLPRIFIVDPSVAVTQRLTAAIADVAHVMGRAGNAQDAFDGICRCQPHLVVFDIVIVNGIRLLRQIKALDPPPIVAVLTHSVEQATRDRCLNLGAEHFLDKLREFEDIRKIVFSLGRGTSVH
jgi:DNA-binding NarL/FixJ family response regulator